MQKIHAWGAFAAGKPLAAMTIERREPGPRDVVLEILFSGVCHSDIHQVRDEWSGALFPMVPGHGIVSDIELIPIQKINEAYERVLKSDVRYRFVIDIASLRG